MKRILFLTLLVSIVSINAFDIVRDAAYTAENAVEGAVDVAEDAVYTAGNIAAAPFRARHYDERNGGYYYVDNGQRIYENGNQPVEYSAYDADVELD